MLLLAACYAVLLFASTFAATMALAKQPWLRFMSLLVASGALVGIVLGGFLQNVDGFGIGGLVIAAGVVPLVIAVATREFASLKNQNR